MTKNKGSRKYESLDDVLPSYLQGWRERRCLSQVKGAQ